MQWNVPGTTLVQDTGQAAALPELFSSMLLTGGLTLSQVANITGLEPYTVQNWVKRRFLPPPQGKRYDLEQLCRIINLNLLKGNLPLEQGVKLMQYLNGDLVDAADDLVPDSQLYFCFVRLAALAREQGLRMDWQPALQELTHSYQAQNPQAGEKLLQVLKIMLTVWHANLLKSWAEQMMQGLEIPPPVHSGAGKEG